LVVQGAQAAVPPTVPDQKMAVNNHTEQPVVETADVPASAQPEVPSQPLAAENLVASGSEGVQESGGAPAGASKAAKKAARRKKAKAAARSADVEGQGSELASPQGGPAIDTSTGTELAVSLELLSSGHGRMSSRQAWLRFILTFDVYVLVACWQAALVSMNAANESHATNVALASIEQDGMAQQLAVSHRTYYLLVDR
jgi:hypothetical protein